MGTVPAGPLIMQPGERCVLNANAWLYAPVAETHGQGGYGGFSVPIGHTGILARVGQFAVHPLATTTMQLVNQGPLYLTDRRIVVVGNAQMSRHHFSDISPR